MSKHDLLEKPYCLYQWLGIHAGPAISPSILTYDHYPSALLVQNNLRPKPILLFLVNLQIGVNAKVRMINQILGF